MRDTSGVASIAISAIPRTNIKRGVLAPRTSQIILVNEADISEAVRDIHTELALQISRATQLQSFQRRVRLA